MVGTEQSHEISIYATRMNEVLGYNKRTMETDTLFFEIKSNVRPFLILPANFIASLSQSVTL